MKKRGGIARAMALDPEIIFCDEPSAGLDPNAAASLDRLINSLQENLGTTFVVVTHELASVFEIADRVLMIRDGRIAAQGTVEEIQANPDPWVQDFLNRVPSGTA
jgi:phospholipid/cholesterol/gamma-HCH transport system ATP-binding protein